MVSRFQASPDIHQTPTYARFMKTIGWKVETIGGVNAFIKTFPLFGSTIKIQRPSHVPSIKKLTELKKKYRAFRVSIEPLNPYKILNTKYNIHSSPYLPTKTIHINLAVSEKKLFQNFSESKRRAVRRALKNNVVIKESTDISGFIKLKRRSFGFLGFLFTRDIKPLWQTFSPKQATLLFAYLNRHSGKVDASTASRIRFGSWTSQDDVSKKPFAGVLLLFNGTAAHYWFAVSTKKGNDVAAPTLLVWEALKLSKKRGCKIFDFEGIYDERFPNHNTNWQGFTKFKSDFGGTEIYFPQPLKID